MISLEEEDKQVQWWKSYLAGIVRKKYLGVVLTGKTLAAIGAELGQEVRRVETLGYWPGWEGMGRLPTLFLCTFVGAPGRMYLLTRGELVNAQSYCLVEEGPFIELPYCAFECPGSRSDCEVKSFQDFLDSPLVISYDGKI